MVREGQDPVSFPPYAASAGWYAIWLRSYLEGSPDPELRANACLGISGRDFARGRIASPSGELLLSVPVEGGAHSLSRRRFLVSARVSAHGGWPRLHLGALEAAYGRTPFYPHLEPLLRGIISDPPEALADLNGMVHSAIAGFLLQGLPHPGELPHPLPRAAVERGEEVAELIFPRLSVIDALMRFGPETLLGLLNLK